MESFRLFCFLSISDTRRLEALTDIAITELISSSSEKLTVLSGGRNHAVYLYDDLGERLCLKRFQSAKNKQARNEWNSLHALHNFTEGMAPEPIRFIEGLDGSCVIAMEYVAGQRLSDVESVSREQLHALAAVTKTIYSMPVGTSSYKYEPVNCVGWANDCVSSYNGKGGCQGEVILNRQR